MTLLAAFQALLHRYSGQDDIAVGTPIAGRTRPEVEDLIGFFVNTLVLRGDLRGRPELPRAAAAGSSAAALAAYAHQDLPFEQLVGVLHPDRDPSRSPLFQVMFALQNAPLPALESPELTMTPLRGRERHGEVRPDAVRHRDGAAAWAWRWSTTPTCSTRRRSTGCSATSGRSWRGSSADPDQPVGALPMLSDEERRRMLGQQDDGDPTPTTRWPTSTGSPTRSSTR